MRTTEAFVKNLLMKKLLLFLVATVALIQSYAQADTAVVASPSAALSFFHVQAVDKVVLLKWSVEQTDEYKSFDIERAEGGSEFLKVGSKLAISRSTNADYDFVDATPKQNTPLRYRLKLISKDGSISYSHLQETTIAGPQLMVRLKQNPVRGNVELELNAPLAKKAIVAIVSANGQPLLSQPLRLSAGLNTLSLPAQAYLPGVYRLAIVAGDEQKTILFIKE